jgi:hypothetical protein
MGGMFDDPVGFFFTWNTYGTWLPGDVRGWIEYRHGFQLPDPILELECAARMTEDACLLSPHQRECVHRQVAETCLHKKWTLHAVNCRSNHAHVVLSAAIHPRIIREQLKAWCTRRLNEQQSEAGIPQGDRRTKWWADRGSVRWIFREDDLAAAVVYTRDQQDDARRFSVS